MTVISIKPESRLLLPRQVVLIAPPDSRRVSAIQSTLQSLKWPAAQVIPYQHIIDERIDITSVLQPNCILKLDSSGEDLATERMLLRLGEKNEQDLTPEQIDTLDLEQGRLMPTRQWYQGFTHFLSQLQHKLPSPHALPHQRTWDSETVLDMFDKRATQQRLRQGNISIPEEITPCASYQQLRDEMHLHKWNKVFLKLAHSSSASGTVALELYSHGIQATSTVHLEHINGEIRLYNSRRLIRYRDANIIEMLINYLIMHHPVQIERWLPKMGMGNRIMDLRVVVTGGKATHTLVRLGRGCMTNLHLRGDRGDLSQFIQKIGDERYQAILQQAESASTCFPKALYAGIDVLVTTTGKTAILEANAFGDYHRNVFYQGLDTYGTQLEALLSQEQ